MKHEWVCCKWLKCRRCENVIKNKWFQKTFSINTTITPKVSSDRKNVSIDVGTTIDDKGGISNELLNVVGALSFNTLSKWALDEYRGKMNELKDELPDWKESQPFEGDRVLIKLVPESARFISNDNNFELEINSKDQVRPGLACAFHNSLPKNTAAKVEQPVQQPKKQLEIKDIMKEDKFCRNANCTDYILR